MMDKQALDASHQDETAYFGYRRVNASEKVDLVQDHFNTVAARYDLTNTILSFGLQHYWKHIAVKMLGLKPGDRVLDVCGGTADLALLASRKIGASGEVVLYDFNRPMIEIGKSKVADASLGEKIRFVQGDAESLSLADERFDAAMVGFGIRNLTHMERGFEEMHRVLKPGGKMMCLDFSSPTNPFFRALYDFYSFTVMPTVGRIFVGSRDAYTYLPQSIRMFLSPEDLKTLLEKIGFSQVTYRMLTNGIAVVHTGVKGRKA